MVNLEKIRKFTKILLRVHIPLGNIQTRDFLNMKQKC